MRDTEAGKTSAKPQHFIENTEQNTKSGSPQPVAHNSQSAPNGMKGNHLIFHPEFTFRVFRVNGKHPPYPSIPFQKNKTFKR